MGGNDCDVMFLDSYERCDEGLSIPLLLDFLSTTVFTLFLRCLEWTGLYLKKNNSNT